jgi:hypothetical protein
VSIPFVCNGSSTNGVFSRSPDSADCCVFKQRFTPVEEDFRRKTLLTRCLTAVAEWMEARGKSVQGQANWAPLCERVLAWIDLFAAVRHQAIQCGHEELDHGTPASVEDMPSEPDPPLSPCRSDTQVLDSVSGDVLEWCWCPATWPAYILVVNGQGSKDDECSNDSEEAPRSEAFKDVISSTTTDSALETASATDSSGLLIAPQGQGSRTFSPKRLGPSVRSP